MQTDSILLFDVRNDCNDFDCCEGLLLIMISLKQKRL